MELIQALRNIIWSTPMLLFLLGTGAYLTWLLRGLQFRYLWWGLKQAFTPAKSSEEASGGDISRFEALMMSLAGAIGTGNIVGVATAIATGGLGAIFWMWVMAVFGMAIKYAEAVLAVRYRIVDDWGEMSGGPMHYIEKGLGWRWLGMIYAACACLAVIGAGNLVQINSIGDVVFEMWSIPPIWTGVVLAAITSVVLVGGVKSIGRVTGILVPFMALLYVGGGLIILAKNATAIPSVFATIITTAFTGQAAFGGFLGSTVMMAVQNGVARGVFTSESGLGISSIAAAAAKTDSPGRQALVAMTGTFLSTVLVCTMTGLVLGVSGVFGQVNPDGTLINGAPLALRAFRENLIYGDWICTIGLILFAYSTAIGWAYYGEKCAEYLFGIRIVWFYRIIFSLLVIPAAAIDLEIVWGIADISNGLMVIPNLIGIIGLSGVVVSETKLFLSKLDSEG